MTNHAHAISCSEAHSSFDEMARHAPTQPAAIVPAIESTKTW